MKQFILALNKILLPILILSYFTLCLVLLAVVPGNKGGLLLAILCAAIAMAALRWSVWGILCRAKKHASEREFVILIRTIEAIMLLLTGTALVFTVLLWEIPSLWIFFPIPLFGLQGAIKLDAER